MPERMPSHSEHDALMRRTIDACSEKAQAFLNSKRVVVDETFVGAKRSPHSTSPKTYQKAEVDNDRAEVERLEAVFAHNASLMTNAERSMYERNKQFADIFEAMFADIAPQIFGENVEVIVPSKFDDYKRQTDLIVVFKDEGGKPAGSLVVDFTTQQDVEGYDTPDGHRGGIEKKWERSLEGIASRDQGLHSVKYARTAGVPTVLNHNPRILVGLSAPEIARLAERWKSGGLNILEEPRIRDLMRSIRKQLIVQLRLAKDNERTKAYSRIVRVLSLSAPATKKIPPETGRITTVDPVVDAINGRLKKEVFTEQYAQVAARKATEEGTPGTPRPLAEWGKDINTPLTEGEGSERERLVAHLTKHNPSGDVLKQVNLVIEGKPHAFTPAMLAIVAGGVPTRLWRRLMRASGESPAIPPVPPGGVPPHRPGSSEGGGGGEEPPTGRLTVAAHLALLKKASGISEEKYAALDTRKKRIFSFIKEKGIRALVAGVGAAIGSTFALAMCAAALPSMIIALGGAIAGSLLGQHLLKKYYYDKHPDKDHTKDRARAAVIQSLSRWAQQYPSLYNQYYGGPGGEALLKKMIERKVFMRNLAGNALAAGIGTVVGLEVRTGGQFTTTLGKSLATGNFDDFWKLFYCPPKTGAGNRSGTFVPDSGRTNGKFVPNGDGRYSGVFEPNRPSQRRLPAWAHNQCISRCNTTAPFGYHSWVPGRIGSDGQQLYALRYRPRG